MVEALRLKIVFSNLNINENHTMFDVFNDLEDFNLFNNLRRFVLWFLFKDI